jgi:[heparan sulfate]-glucosamine 3-sulfotransferase 2
MYLQLHITCLRFLKFAVAMGAARIVKTTLGVLCVWSVMSAFLLVSRNQGTFKRYNTLNSKRYLECTKESCGDEPDKVQSVSNSRSIQKQIILGTPRGGAGGDNDTMKPHEKLECSEGKLKTDTSDFKRAAQLDPSSYHNTMVKLGTDVKFDVMTRCPTGSHMLNRQQHPPQHTNCPTLYVVGTRKGGTTSLYQYVSKHPDFQGVKLDAGTRAGEAFYFHQSKLGSWKKYISKFPTNGTMSGESTVAYLVGSLVPKRLHSACGKQAKVVMLLRDPIKRLKSNFLMRTHKRPSYKLRGKSISYVVKRELDGYLKAVNEIKSSHNNLTEWSQLVGLFNPAKNMVYEGLYYVHLMNWLCNFPAENILVINSEEFFKKPSKILDIVFQFLGLRKLESNDQITSATYNRGNYNVPPHKKLSGEDVKNLLTVFKPFNQALFELLKWEDHEWLMGS